MAGRLGSGLWEEILQARHVHHREHRDVEGASRETWRADQVTDWRAALAEAKERLDRSLLPGVHIGSEADPRAALIEVAAVACAWADAMDNRPGETR